MSLASLFSIAPGGGSFTMRFLAIPLCATFVVACVAAGRHYRRTLLASITAAFVLAAIWAALYVWRPRWLVLALDDPRGAVTPSDFVWIERAPGLDTTEIAIDLAGERVDSIALVRIDPAQYRLSVHWDATGSRSVDVWQRELGAAVVINGSYFEPDRSPSTPLRIAGSPVGPMDYTSIHGALVIDDGAVDIVDLRGRDVATELARHREAMVSYPLLVDPSGRSRAAGNDDWFANRVFVALDTSGRIVIGTTRTGFFSLRRLGDTLARADRLSLRVALNLDGGPIASQIVSVPGYSRTVLGDAEVTGGHDLLRLAYQSIRHASGQQIGLPIVLAVRAR
jgi:hypothetical protein